MTLREVRWVLTVQLAERPLNTDKQADKLARRKVHLDRRRQRIEIRRDERVGRLEERIKKIKADAEERTKRIDEVRVPIRDRLINFVMVVRDRRQRLTLSTGTQLDVYTNYKVVAKDGDDDAAVAELEKKGHGDMVRVKKEPNRQLLAQKSNRHIVEASETLSLEPVRTLNIKLAKQ